MCKAASHARAMCTCASGMQTATIDADLTAKQLTVSVSQQVCCLALQPCQLLHASQMCSAHSPPTSLLHLTIKPSARMLTWHSLQQPPL